MIIIFDSSQNRKKPDLAFINRVGINNALQHTATHCSTLQRTASRCKRVPDRLVSPYHKCWLGQAMMPRRPYTYNTAALLHTATPSWLQRTATHCNTHYSLQHTLFVKINQDALFLINQNALWLIIWCMTQGHTTIYDVWHSHLIDLDE